MSVRLCLRLWVCSVLLSWAVKFSDKNFISSCFLSYQNPQLLFPKSNKFLRLRLSHLFLILRVDKRKIQNVSFDLIRQLLNPGFNSDGLISLTYLERLKKCEMFEILYCRYYRDEGVQNIIENFYFFMFLIFYFSEIIYFCQFKWYKIKVWP